MYKITNPPESTKRTEDCKFRVQGDTCCNSLNHLRSHKCSHYCVVKLDKWVSQTYPDLDKEGIEQKIIKIVEL